MIRKICVTVFAALMASVPVAAQEAPAAGSGGGSTAWMATMPAGSWVIIGGVLFIMTGEGLTDDNKKKVPVPTPTPAPPPSSTTTAATSTS